MSNLLFIFSLPVNWAMFIFHNRVENTNISNNHLVSIAEKTRANGNDLHKVFSECMENNSSKSFFYLLLIQNEILSIISSLNPNKSVGANSLTTKIVKLFKNEI